MTEELNINELLAELAVYRWRDKKAVILKELDLKYEANRPFTLIEVLNISKGADDLINISKESDDLLSKGYTFDEILRAIREWVQERLDEIEKEKEDRK
ncbi:MAG: hypothetical protein M0R38_10065 [Bacteroidia bacterium]|nr:hypothetical protein [Bacteroidia bacterium]